MPSIEILSIGDELLSGKTVNTNASYLSKRLEMEGYEVGRHTVTSDCTISLQEMMKEASNRCEVVLCTGGLGPTVDDCTRKAACELFKDKLVYNESVAKKLVERFGSKLSTLEDQSTLPAGAKVLDNLIGTASGSIFEHKNRVVILLPGVPKEMESMFDLGVLPYLKQNFPSSERRFVKPLHLFGLYESDVTPLLNELAKQFHDVQFAIYPHVGKLTIHLKALGGNHPEEFIREPLKKLTDAFSDHIFDSPSGTFEEAVHISLLEKKSTVSCAESCTGGALAQAFTKIPGASEHFLGSIIAYSNKVKMNTLKVSEKTLIDHGAVSEQAAREMVIGAQKLTGSDYALAVTGIAGPDGGTLEKPVGTVWCGIATPNEVNAFRLNLRGDRELIVQQSVQSLLSALYRKINI